jgi:predicted outer membrane repeat protein
MAEIITCPACQRKLQVPESFYGQTVQCPECRQLFVANPHAESVQATPPAAVPAPIAPPDVPPLGASGAYDERDELHDRLPLWRNTAPHRGGAILALGIIALVIPCADIICAPIAWIMGNNDLREIRAGRMDQSGEGMTQAGRIIGIVASVKAVFAYSLVCIYFMFIIYVIKKHG